MNKWMSELGMEASNYYKLSEQSLLSSPFSLLHFAYCSILHIIVKIDLFFLSLYVFHNSYSLPYRSNLVILVLQSPN